jgi:hypothetical protein
LLAAHLEAARAAVDPVPLRLAETGYSTALSYDVLRGVPASPSAREAQQAYYLRSVAAVARRLGLPPVAPWVLSDFTPDAIPPDDPGVYRNAREYRFGVFRVSGEAKPAAAALRGIFSGARPGGFNGGFEDSVRDERGRPVPALWRIRPAQNSAFSRDGEVAYAGRGSARIDGTGRGTAADGGVQSAPLRCGESGWQTLRARGAAPAGAAFVGIYLRAARTVGPAWFDDVRYACVRGRARATG